MTTTTIRLPEAPKARIAKAVKRSVSTTHGFIPEAIAEKVGKEELRAEFNKTADDRLAAIAATGKTIHWPVARDYLLNRVAGVKAKRPTLRILA